MDFVLFKAANEVNFWKLIERARADLMSGMLRHALVQGAELGLIGSCFVSLAVLHGARLPVRGFRVVCSSQVGESLEAH